MNDLKVLMKKCFNCGYFEENGIMFSAVPECMYYKEYACEATKYYTCSK